MAFGTKNLLGYLPNLERATSLHTTSVSRRRSALIKTTHEPRIRDINFVVRSSKGRECEMASVAYGCLTKQICTIHASFACGAICRHGSRHFELCSSALQVHRWYRDNNTLAQTFMPQIIPSTQRFGVDYDSITVHSGLSGGHNSFSNNLQTTL
jgi:hypothetical protein